MLNVAKHRLPCRKLLCLTSIYYIGYSYKKITKFFIMFVHALKVQMATSLSFLLQKPVVVKLLGLC